MSTRFIQNYVQELLNEHIPPGWTPPTGGGGRPGGGGRYPGYPEGIRPLDPKPQPSPNPGYPEGIRPLDPKPQPSPYPPGGGRPRPELPMPFPGGGGGRPTPGGRPDWTNFDRRQQAYGTMANTSNQFAQDARQRTQQALPPPPSGSEPIPMPDPSLRPTPPGSKPMPNRPLKTPGGERRAIGVDSMGREFYNPMKPRQAVSRPDPRTGQQITYEFYPWYKEEQARQYREGAGRQGPLAGMR